MRPKKIKKIVHFLLVPFLGGLFLFCLPGCSTIRNSLFWEKFCGSKEIDSKDDEISQFFSSIRQSPGNADSHYLLACYYQERGRHKDAIRELRKVLSIDPRYIRAYNGLGVSHDLLGDFQAAIEFYQRGLQLNPHLDYMQNNLGYSLFIQGDLDGAISAFKKAIALNSQDSRFHNNLALAYGEKGEHDLALVEFKMAGDEAKAHYNMAQVYYKKGLYNRAKSHYAKALKLNPSSTIARTGLEATSALTSIFGPATKKAKVEDLVVPENSGGKRILLQIEKQALQDQDKPVIHSQTGLGETNASVPAFPFSTAGSRQQELMTPEKFFKSELGSEKFGVIPSANLIADSLASERAHSRHLKVSYEVEGASFSPQKNAARKADSLYEENFGTIIRYSKEKGWR